jgi:MarR family transcriptional regulator, lower aerobic nicotinate degradation pathway regulator
MARTKIKQVAERGRSSDDATGDYVLEEQVGYGLRCAHQRATEIFNSVMEKFGVTATQFAALAKLDDLGAVSQNRLGRLITMEPATISGVVSRLVARGLMRQAIDPQDARLTALSLTPDGKAAVTEMKGHAAEVSRRTLAPLTSTEAAAFLRALDKLR